MQFTSYSLAMSEHTVTTTKMALVRVTPLSPWLKLHGGPQLWNTGVPTEL